MKFQEFKLLNSVILMKDTRRRSLSLRNTTKLCIKVDRQRPKKKKSRHATLNFPSGFQSKKMNDNVNGVVNEAEQLQEWIRGWVPDP